MTDLYSFDTYKGYRVVVEPLDEGGYEGIAYIHDCRNPQIVVEGKNGEIVRQRVLDHIDRLRTVSNE